MKETLAQIYARSHPGKVAAKLASYEPKDVIEFLSSLAPAVEASVVAKLSSAKAITVLATMTHGKVASLVNEASHDDSLTLISYLPTSRYAEIAAASTQSRQIKERLYGYSAKSLGAMASPDFIAVEKGQLVSELLQELQSQLTRTDLPLFVVEDNCLLGRLPLLPLLSAANAELPVEKLMLETATLNDNANASSVLAPDFWTDGNVLPIVDRGQRLIGVVSRQQLEALSLEPVAEGVSVEEIATELSSGYLLVCSNLLDALVGASSKEGERK